AILERDELRAMLEHDVLAKAVAFEHLQHEPAEVTDPLLARAHEHPALAPQDADVRDPRSRLRGHGKLLLLLPRRRSRLDDSLRLLLRAAQGRDQARHRGSSLARRTEP